MIGDICCTMMTVNPVGVNYWANLALGRRDHCEEAICVSCEKSNECWKGSRENYLGGARPHCGRCWHAVSDERDNFQRFHTSERSVKLEFD